MTNCFDLPTPNDLGQEVGCLMNSREYHIAMFDKLQNAFAKSSWVLGYGPELIAHGWAPDKLLVTAQPLDQLWRLTVEWDLEVFLPIFGKAGEYVLAPMDYEIFLADANYTIYSERHSQLHYFMKYIQPVTRLFEAFLKRYRVPYFADLTPSGGHFLFYVQKDTPEYAALAGIGCLEPELASAYCYEDQYDIKRTPAAGIEAGKVFSGIGRLWNYLSLLVKTQSGELGLPVTICDTEHKCINLDNSWAAFPGYMRIIRSPFSLHKKNIHKFHQADFPLCDVAHVYNDGDSEIRFDDMNYLTKCMWDLELACQHHQNFSGFIPVSNANLVDLIEDSYKRSQLYHFDQEFDATPSRPLYETYDRALHDKTLNPKTHHMMTYPNPRALQPRVVKKFVADLVDKGWNPKHIGDLINDIYCKPQFGWREDWFKNVSRTRANYWARVYAAEHLIETGKLRVA